MKLSVVVPFYNDAEKVNETLKKISHYLNDKEFSHELIPVNDGSTDNTEKKIKNYAKESSRIKPILYENNKGKGYAVKKGMIASDGDFVLFTDSDLSVPVQEIDKLLHYVGEYDIIIGSRELAESTITKRRPLYKRAWSKMTGLITRFFLQVEYQDTQCGFKLFTRDTIELFHKQKIHGFGFDFEILFLAEKEGYKVKELPITWGDTSNSSLNITDWFWAGLELIQVRINNLRGLYSRDIF